jgi:hypothetical protein
MHNDTYAVTIDRPNGSWEMVHDDSGDVVATGDTGVSSEEVLDAYESDVVNRHDLSETDALAHRQEARDRTIDVFDLRRAERLAEESPDSSVAPDDFTIDNALIEYEDIRE